MADPSALLVSDNDCGRVCRWAVDSLVVSILPPHPADRDYIGCDGAGVRGLDGEVERLKVQALSQRGSG